MNDFHIHATAYRPTNPQGDMSVAEIARRCAGMGYAAIGLLDHVNANPKNPPGVIAAIVASCRLVAGGIAVCAGAEADIADVRGTVTCTAEFAGEQRLAYVIASIHDLGAKVSNPREYVELCHRALMAAVEQNRHVDVIGHPWGHAMAGKCGAPDGQSAYGVIPEHWQREFVGALATRGVAIEVNAKKSSPDFLDAAYRRFIGWARDAEVRVMCGSDAHVFAHLGTTPACETFLREMGYPDSLRWRPTEKAQS